MSIEKAANEVTAQAQVVADQVQANPTVVNEASLKTLQSACKKLEDALGGY